MGTEICTRAERRVNGHWQAIDFEPFQQLEKHYDLYGFLADVRNAAEVPPLARPRGVPDDFVDASEWSEWFYDCSYVTVAELVAFDYDKTFEDRRTWFEDPAMSGVIRRGPSRKAGEGQIKTIRALLGPTYFEDLERLQREGAERVVFGFY